MALTPPLNWAHVAAEFSRLTCQKMLLIPLIGVDRVALLMMATHDVSLIVRAAMSTF